MRLLLYKVLNINAWVLIIFLDIILNFFYLTYIIISDYYKILFNHNIFNYYINYIFFIIV